MLPLQGGILLFTERRYRDQEENDATWNMSARNLFGSSTWNPLLNLCISIWSNALLAFENDDVDRDESWEWGNRV